MKQRVRSLRTRIANGWIWLLFWNCAHAPWVVRLLEPHMTAIAWACSPYVRRVTRTNAKRLLGPSSSPQARKELGRAVFGNCIDAVVEFGRNRNRTTEQILSRLESVKGEDEYSAARQQRRGAILVTAHLGAFETAMTMLAQREPKIHVVFRRDPSSIFERLRSEQHARLGILDAPVDDGLSMWFGLRDALRNDEVVLMQGDRVLPGQPGVAVPFLGGRMRVPTGPVKLARITGAPLIPTFAIQMKNGRVRIVIEKPIWMCDHPLGNGRTDTSIDPALLRLTSVIEQYVQSYPEQWLCLHLACCDDAGPDFSR